MIKTLEGKIGEYFLDLGVGEEFLNRVQKALMIEGRKINKLDYIKIENFCSKIL